MIAARPGGHNGVIHECAAKGGPRVHGFPPIVENMWTGLLLIGGAQGGTVRWSREIAGMRQAGRVRGAAQ